MILWRERERERERESREVCLLLTLLLCNQYRARHLYPGEEGEGRCTLVCAVLVINLLPGGRNLLLIVGQPMAGWEAATN